MSSSPLTSPSSATRPQASPEAAPSPSAPERRTPRLRVHPAWLLGAALLLGAVLRAWLALHDDGIYWPDEIYQSFEPAHRLVFGYGLIPWEFVKGARNWALPGLVAGVMELTRALGLHQPRGYLDAVKLLFAGLGVGTGWATWRLARGSGAGLWASAIAAAAFLLAAPAIYFGPRALSGTACALPLALGLALLLESRGGRARVWTGGCLLGLATLLRLQCGVFCVGILVVLAVRAAREKGEPAKASRMRLGELTAVLTLWAGLYGLLDRLTWGGWFHSVAVYLRFNLVQGKASLWGTASALYYAHTLFTSMPVLAVALLLGFVLACRKAPGLAALAFAFLLLHSLVPHKELRFIYPDFPLLFALLGVGLASLPSAPRPWALGLVGAVALFSAARWHTLTFGELGAYSNSPAKQRSSAYDDFGALNRLLIAAHGRKDLCGLEIPMVHPAWTGGYTYLDRDVPLYGPHRMGARGTFNYAIVPRRVRARKVAVDGPFALIELFPGPCRPDPQYSWRLP